MIARDETLALPSKLERPLRYENMGPLTRWKVAHVLFVALVSCHAPEHPRSPAARPGSADLTGPATSTGSGCPRCTTTSRHTPAPASPLATQPDCVDPVANARARLAGASAATLELDPHPPDLDGDGAADVVVLEGDRAREPWHVLYVRTSAGCSRFVGQIRAFRLACGDGRDHGLCDLWIETWLMHGDRLRSRWTFNGTTYVQLGDGEVIPGPRK